MPAHRNTRQKSLILDALKSSKHHITADELIDILKSGGVEVGRATVYRYLKELEESGQVKKYSLGEKKCSCYQYMEPHSDCQEHYHLVCERCGKLEHIESGVIKAFAENARESFGFEIDEGRTVFYGFCKNCVGKDKNA